MNDILKSFLEIKDKKDIILTRMICSCVSLCFCFGMIIIYIVLCFQVRYNKKKEIKLSDCEKTSITSNTNRKIGLGSHFMFFLILSNFFSSIIPIIYYVADQNNLINSKVTPLCTALGFFHNYLDLCAVCWTSVIVKLFLISTRITEFLPGQEKKTMVVSTLYSFIFPFLFTAVPFCKPEPYGNADTHCSFYYPDNKDEKRDHPIPWNYIFTGFVCLNLLYNFYCLFHVIRYYSNKIKNYQKDSNDYKVINRYVNVFRIFPLVLILSRSAKGVNRGVITMFALNNETILAIISYTGSILYCLNGLFNSLICVYFFRGVFTCWKAKAGVVEEIDSLEGEGQCSLLVPKAEETDEEEINKESCVED